MFAHLLSDISFELFLLQFLELELELWRWAWAVNPWLVSDRVLTAHPHYLLLSFAQGVVHGLHRDEALVFLLHFLLLFLLFLAHQCLILYSVLKLLPLKLFFHRSEFQLVFPLFHGFQVVVSVLIHVAEPLILSVNALVLKLIFIWPFW